jgi:hypothetical protein
MQSPVYQSGIGSLYARLLLRSGGPRRRKRATALLSHAYQLSSQARLTSLIAVCRGLADRHSVVLESLPVSGSV